MHWPGRCFFFMFFFPGATQRYLDSNLAQIMLANAEIRLAAGDNNTHWSLTCFPAQTVLIIICTGPTVLAVQTLWYAKRVVWKPHRHFAHRTYSRAANLPESEWHDATWRYNLCTNTWKSVGGLARAAEIELAKMSQKEALVVAGNFSRFFQLWLPFPLPVISAQCSMYMSS